MDIVTIIISAFALFISLTSALWNFLRERRESTIRAYTLFQNEVVPEISRIKNMFRERGVDLMSMNNAQISDLISANTEITVCLVRIEYFCVGVNMKVYSIKTLNRMGGSFFCDVFETFRPIIQVKRINNRLHGKHYDEFEKCVQRLKQLRSRSRYYR
jgi:hypothetical protein